MLNLGRVTTDSARSWPRRFLSVSPRRASRQRRRSSANCLKALIFTQVDGFRKCDDVDWNATVPGFADAYARVYGRPPESRALARGLSRARALEAAVAEAFAGFTARFALLGGGGLLSAAGYAFYWATADTVRRREP